MGQLSTILKTCPCDSWAKYVFNSMHIESRCCECFECEFVTEKVDIPDDVSEIEIEDCCFMRHN